MPIHASRLYVDLVHSGTSRWANWEPPVKVVVGDYGVIDEESGQFVRYGSLYEDFQDTDLQLEKYPPQLMPVENDFLFTTAEVRRIDIGMGPSVKAPGIVELSFEGHYVFGRERGALLAMSKPRLQTLPYNFPFLKLVNIKQLENKAIVVNAFICPSFALYLSQGKEDAISLSADLSAPLPAALGFEAGGKAHVGLKSEQATRFPRTAKSKDYDFTPLYTLKTNKRRGLFHLTTRDERHDELSDPSDVLASFPLPWDTLDNDGDEAPEDE